MKESEVSDMVLGVDIVTIVMIDSYKVVYSSSEYERFSLLSAN